MQYKGPDVYETYGIQRNFVQIDYTDSKNLTVLNIQQFFHSTYSVENDYFGGMARNFTDGVENMLYSLDNDVAIINASIVKMMANLGTAETTIAKFNADAATGAYGASYDNYLNDLLNNIMEEFVDSDLIMANWNAGVSFAASR
ncbi:MAG: hypothetical protein LBT55_04775 [Clostridiaceae bacterium]|nr:hypothetical protein [Clostridiaceae bacterium]